MTYSPPPEAAEFRGQTLTPVSPKPVHYPSPSNIPILEKSMDPNFHDTLAQGAHSAAFQPVPQHDSLPTNAFSYDLAAYAQQYGMHSGSMGGAMAAGGQGNDEFAQSLAHEGAKGSSNQDTIAIQNVAYPGLPTAEASSEAGSASNATDRAFAPASYDAASSYQGSSGPDQAHGAFTQPSMGGAGSGGVDFQSILDKLSSPTANANAPSADGNTTTTISSPTSTSQLSGVAAIGSPPIPLPGNSSLPPRPPPQEKPATHPNYAPGDDIRAYHPHSQKIPGAAYRAQSNLPPLLTAAATGANGLPPPPVATFQQPSSATQRTQSPAVPCYRQRDTVEKRPDKETADDDDAAWGPDEQRLYDEFLQDERMYVTEGQWDKFPTNSRLFIGNLPTEKVSKRDLFHIFHKHGKLAQISIKQAYGFVQFLDSAACYRALEAEQSQSVRGRKMHLEISKPQRNTRNADNKDKESRGARRRSRSPDYNRGGSGQQGPRGVDRYTSAQNGSSPRDRRARDDYRPGRSPSPRGFRGGRGGRDRSRDRLDGRRRSRSRSPYGRGGRYRSPSPRRDLDDDLPLPRRAPRDVPDVQIIVLDDLDRNFIAYVEKGFQERGVRCDVLLLSPRLSEEAVIRRQVLEGVQAVSRVTRMSQQTGKIPIRVFDRRGGVDNVRFDEYDNLDPSVCAELVNRAKQTHGVPQQPQYAAPPIAYGMPPQYGLPPAQPAPSQLPMGAAATNPNLTNILSSLNGADLQKLLGAVQQQPPHAANPTGLTPELARLLGGAAAAAAPQQQHPAYAQQQPQQQQPTNPYGALAGNPTLASLLGGAATQTQTPTLQQQQQQQQQQQMAPAASGAAPPAQGQPNMQEIMAQLAKYRR